MRILSAVSLFTLASFFQPTTAHANYISAWGDNTYGQTNVPSGLTNVVAVALGWTHALALTSDGKVVTWGNDISTVQLNVPSDLTNVVAIDAGDNSSLALNADGTVRAWGFGASDVPSGLAGVVSVSAGSDHNLALRANGTVVAWGYNSSGQTVVPKGLTNVIAVSAGGAHSLALRADGTVVAWGDTFGGNLLVPSDLTNAIAISAGVASSLALRADGTVAAWGAASVPGDLTNVISISSGRSIAALKADGTVAVLGQGTVPPGLSGVTAVAVSKQFSASFLALNGVAQSAVTIPFISPSNQTIAAGSQAFFSVGAVGTSPLKYQWYFFATNAIVGATNRWLVLPNAHPSQSGVYTVVVSNTEASATSQPVTLNVIPSIDIAAVAAIKLNGETGSTFRIDYRAQAAVTGDWAPLATVTLTNNLQYYVDLSSIGQPARFYRLVQLP